MDQNTLIAELTIKKDKTMSSFNHELAGLRTGRASINFLDSVSVEAYGSKMPLSQLSTISITDSRTLSVQVWDVSLSKAVEKGIVDANLGVSVVPSDSLIRVSIPMLSEERRKELAKLAHKYGENTKVSLRNVRRDGMDILKKAEKDSEISKDEHHKISDQIQKLTDKYVSKVDELVLNKEKEITTI